MGLRYGDAASSHRRIGRTELKRGLKKLNPTHEVDGADGARDRNAAPLASSLTSGWSELEVDELLTGLVALQSRDRDRDREGVTDGLRTGGNGMKEILDFTEDEFRERLILAMNRGESDVDRVLEAGQEVMPLVERLEVRRLAPRGGGGRFGIDIACG